ncbi:MAG TPA: fibronectin type III domain-containing protein [Terriglobales bacterium]|nr:fibronectin type III domain-containing protein [Terriglobales bacterium]
MKSTPLTAVALMAILPLVACGMPGAPQPPSLELPRRVQNLNAVRKGDQVTLTWTTPRETTDRTRIKHLGVTRICRVVDRVAVAECVERVGTLPPEHTPLAAAVSFTDTLPVELQAAHASGFASYAVEVQNSRGRTAGLSNQATVPLAPTLPPPEKLLREVTANGVVISWVVPLDEMQVLSPGQPADRLQYRLRIYRRDKSRAAAAPIEISTTGAFVTPRLPQPNWNILDTSAEWEHEYIYWADIETTVLGTDGKVVGTVEGANSPELDVVVHDVFPPDVPAGLQAVSSGTSQQPFIDLSWAPNTESDLAGYNVYRHEEGAASVKINSEVVKAPTYRDATVQAGRRYSYSITAVDVRGNESGRSAEASEAGPQ